MHKVIIWDLLGLIECIYIFKIMNMSKECMSSNRMSEQYRIGVTNFVSHSKAIFGDSNFVKCSCSSCGNTRRINVTQIETHLILKGVDLSYTKWVFITMKVVQHKVIYWMMILQMKEGLMIPLTLILFCKWLEMRKKNF